MSRAKLPPDELRKRIVSIRCSQAEFQDIEKAADLAQLNISDWVRDTVVRASSVRVVAGAAGAVREYRVGDPTVPERAVPDWRGAYGATVGNHDVVTASSQIKINAPTEPPDFKPAAVTEEWREIPLASHSPWPQPELLPHVDPAELPLSWADHWAQMERMEPQEATDRLYELAAGRKFPDGFPRWPKARKIEWLDKEWKL